MTVLIVKCLAWRLWLCFSSVGSRRDIEHQFHVVSRFSVDIANFRIVCFEMEMERSSASGYRRA